MLRGLLCGLLQEQGRASLSKRNNLIFHMVPVSDLFLVEYRLQRVVAVALVAVELPITCWGVVLLDNLHFVLEVRVVGRLRLPPRGTVHGLGPF